MNNRAARLVLLLITLTLQGRMFLESRQEPSAQSNKDLALMKRRAEVAEDAKALAEGEKEIADARIKELEGKLTSANAAITKKPDAWKDAEIKKLRERVGLNGMRRSIRDQITKLLNEGAVIRDACLEPNAKPDDLRKLTNDWAGRSVNALAVLEPSWAARFNTATAAQPLVHPGTAVDTDSIWNFVNIRMEILKQILGEIHDS
ncbi:MAG: hypothetical protein ABSB82_07155 [Terriglobia bacterium]|jgi:hypothetical protein